MKICNSRKSKISLELFFLHSLVENRKIWKNSRIQKGENFMTNFKGHKSLNEVPIFFATDNNYLPFLDVALRSLIANASRDYKYRIVILNVGLDKDKMDKIMALQDDNFIIDFVNISHEFEDIRHKLKNIFHFSLACYYRLFIENLFPEYDKILYLDCDIIVLGDISKLYFEDVKDYAVAGVVEQHIKFSPVFSNYTKKVVGVDCNHYINSGIMIMNLKKIRELQVEEKFVDLINRYNFDVIDPDQAYINYLCKGHIKFLPIEWNRTTCEKIECKKPQIVHYALGEKPWDNKKTFLGKYFWKYAITSSFYEDILQKNKQYDSLAKLKKQRAGIDIQIQALECTMSKNTFVNMLGAH